jgi:hypothetical protein
MFCVLKANRECGGEAARARKLTIIGDNYSENRNYTILFFLSELVAWGWYDEVEVLFGPVGHTHNGIDSTHMIHNVYLLGSSSGPSWHIADLMKKFTTVWCSPP